MTKDTLYGVRDPYGFRPLCIGRTDEGGWVLASETCALDAIGAKFVRDVHPGEFVQINENGVKSTIFAKAPRKQVCSFEYIYFARPDSVIDGQDVYQARLNMGREMWNETQYDADIVISSRTAATRQLSATPRLRASPSSTASSRTVTWAVPLSSRTRNSANWLSA